MLGEHKENILAVSNLYKKAKERLKIEADVPYLFAEDETAIIPRPEYISLTLMKSGDSVEGKVLITSARIISLSK